MNTKPVEEHYTPKQIAALLRVHVNQARAMLVPGKIWPVVRLNRQLIRVPASSVNRYLDAHTWKPKEIAPADPFGR